MSRRSRQIPEKIRHNEVEDRRRNNRKTKRSKREEHGQLPFPLRSNACGNRFRIKNRTCSEYRPIQPPVDQFVPEATATRSLTYTARDETEHATTAVDSLSTSSSSRKKTKVSQRRPQRKKSIAQNSSHFDCATKKIGEDDETPPSFTAQQKSSSHQVASTQASVLLTQEDSQASQQSFADKQMRFYETNMQKRMKEFVDYCLQTSMDVLNAQYEQLQTIMPSKADAFMGMLPVNNHKNRYHDIYCLDNSRVVLHRLGDKYIHANYVRHKVLQNDFILTQGPLSNTISDFWHMVWQERSGLIFMLCKFVEDHKVKCAEYLPTLQSRVIEHAGIRIELRERCVTKRGNVIITQLLLSQKQTNLTVMHYQWTSWADHQVPVNDYKTPFYLLKKSRISPTCTVVHCSAGVGRSGTLVAIELCLMQLVAGNELVVPDMVAYIRRKRAQSVQTKEQYLYIYRALVDFAVSNHITCARKVQPFIEKYQQICATDENH